jgi:predicted DNA-binding transcriptional regulator AlpA
MSDPPRSLYTFEMLSEFLGVPIATLRAWRSRCEGPPSLKVGRHVRYRPEDVDRWIADRVDDNSRGKRLTDPGGRVRKIEVRRPRREGVAS